MSDGASRFGWSRVDHPQMSQCVFCRHKSTRGAVCTAFPSGIPGEILRNEHDHRQPFDGDNGIRFEPDPGQRSPFEEGE